MGLATILLLLIPLGFLLGSIPFGLLVGLAKGKDPRLHGSGNIGATNVGRIFGTRYFVLVFLLDALKGMLPVVAAAAFIHAYVQTHFTTLHWSIYLLWLASGFAAVLGHMFSPFLGFKGGKGVATSFGVALGLFPYFTYPSLIAIAVWAIVLAAKRYVSLASITAVLAFAVAYVTLGLLYAWHPFGSQWPLLAFALLLVSSIIVRHRTNIVRLLNGTEHRIGQTKTAGATVAPPVHAELSPIPISVADIVDSAAVAAPILPCEAIPPAQLAPPPHVAPLGRKTASGFAWTMIQTVGTKIVNFAGTIVLARWLTNSDWALSGKVFAIVIFANLIQEAGLQQVLIHRQAEFARWANGAFWMSIAAGLLGMTVMAVLAHPAQIFFHAPGGLGGMGAMMLVLAIRSPFLALATVPTAQLQNELRFKLLSAIQLIVAAVVMLLTILFAWKLPLPYKAQAFVLPLLAGAILRAVIVLIVAPPPLKASFEWRTWQMLAGSSAILLLANFFFTVTAQGVPLVLGKLQSDYVQGIYVFAYNLTLQTTQFLTVNLAAVLFPALSKLQHDPARQRQAFLKATDMLMLLGVPLCLLQAALAAPAVHLFFGPKWETAIGTLQLISIGMSLQLVNMPAMGMIQAQGRFKTLLALSILCAVLFLGMIFLGAHSGSGPDGIIQWPWLKRPLEALMGKQANVAAVVALAVGLYCAIIGPTCIYAAIRTVGGTWRQIAVIYLRPLALSVAAIAVGMLVCWRVPAGKRGDWIRLFGVTAIAVAVYLPAMRRLARSTWDILVQRLMDMVR